MFSCSNFRNIDTSSNKDCFIILMEKNPYKIALAFAEDSFLDSLNCKRFFFITNEGSFIDFRKVPFSKQTADLIVTF